MKFQTFNWVIGVEGYDFDLYSSYRVNMLIDQLMTLAPITTLAVQIYQRPMKQLHPDFMNNIINYHIFKRSYSDLVCDKTCFELVNSNLYSLQLCRFITSNGKQFLAISHYTTFSAMVGYENKAYQLENILEMRLERDIEKLENSINECSQTSKKFTNEEMFKMALVELKKKWAYKTSCSIGTTPSTK